MTGATSISNMFRQRSSIEYNVIMVQWKLLLLLFLIVNYVRIVIERFRFSVIEAFTKSLMVGVKVLYFQSLSTTLRVCRAKRGR